MSEQATIADVVRLFSEDRVGEALELFVDLGFATSQKLDDGRTLITPTEEGRGALILAMAGGSIQ